MHLDCCQYAVGAGTPPSPVPYLKKNTHTQQMWVNNIWEVSTSRKHNDHNADVPFACLGSQTASGFSSPMQKSACLSGFVGCSEGSSSAVVRELNGHLDEGIWTVTPFLD